jgi:two-component system, NtrC family, nitrogen regulation sensor histidine kinase NtrY
MIAAAGALPAVAVALWFAWTRAPTFALALVASALLLLPLIAAAIALRRRVVAPLQTLANVVEAVRYGDFGLRGRRARPGDALGEVVREINALSAGLHEQRLAALEASALVQTVLEELDTAVFTFDGEGRVKLVNRAAAELLGRGPESLLRCCAPELGLAELASPADPDRPVQVMSLNFPGRAGRFEVRRRSFREGGVPHVVVMLSDLSRTLREEERRAWQRLIRVIGHEINNSLTPIKSLAGTLRDVFARELPAADRDDAVESLGLIADRADSLSKFVATYSQLARLPPPALQEVSLDALLHRLVALPAWQRVQLDAPYPVSAPVDPGQLEQALINLLKNAFEAVSLARGADGGAVDSAVQVVLMRTRESAVIEVRDKGPGITNAENLFVPFFTTKPGGSGIGLALSRQIVEGHGGTLTLENRTDGSGCIARVSLPMTARSGPASAA